LGKLVRKNLMVEDVKLKELARRQGVSESAAVRQAVDYALVAEEVMAVIRELHARGGIDDVFGKLEEIEDEASQ